METKKLKIKQIDIPVYKAKIYICTGDYDDYCDYISEIKNVSREDLCAYGSLAQCNDFGLSQYCWIGNSADIAIVVHELSHAIFGIMKYLGLDINDEEVFCYMLEYAFNEFLCIIPPIQMDLAN